MPSDPDDLISATIPDSASPSIPPDARCKTCGYLLRGLPEPRCPECGHAFDPANLDSMDIPSRTPEELALRLPPLPTRLTFLAWINTALGALNCLAADTRIFRNALALSWFVVLACASIPWMLLPMWRRHRGKETAPPPDGARFALVSMLVTAMALSSGFYTCMHATTVWLFGIGISYSSNGGPCHSEPHSGGCHLGGNWYLAY